MKNNKKCVVCGGPLPGKQRKYCSESCFSSIRKEQQKKSRDKNKDKRRIYNKKYYKENREKNKERSKEYYKNNKDKFRLYNKKNEKRIKKRKKLYRKNNKGKIKLYEDKNKERRRKYFKKYSLENKDKIKEYDKQYRKDNIDKIKEKDRKYYIRMKRSIAYKIHGNIACGIRQDLKSKNLSKNGRKSESLLINTFQEIKEHLEKNFLPGMTWKNMGRNGWHIHHIIPKEFFKFTSTDDVEFKYCWSIENLQPLWEEDNLEKSDKVMLWGKEINARNIDRDYFQKIKY